jgi:hypothetical protein
VAKTAAWVILVGVLFCSGCERLGQTPLEQAPLETLTAKLEAPIYLTVQEHPVNVAALVRVAGEFERHRLQVAVVWQMRQAPTTEMMASFAGKSFRQYYDPKGLMPGTGLQVSVHGQMVAIQELPLRIAFARAVLR